MEELLLLCAVFLFAPIIISIVAIAKVTSLKSEVERLRAMILERGVATPRTEAPAMRVEESFEMEPVAAATDSPRPVEPQTIPVPASPPPVEPPRVPPLPTATAIPKQPKPKVGMEFMMGGRAAAFAGIAILVTGIVFLVGYAIQKSWIGPGTRIVLGLISGGTLVAVGHFVSRRDEKLMLFGRVLTGGGSALFYFTVFAAYGVYHLIGPVAAGAGLFASALAVFGLAMVYRSQSVGVLGVLGAFVTPLLIGGDLEAGVFPLVYIALVNVPVILLGVRRKWQILYNLAFVFTLTHYLLWFNWVSDSEVGAGIGFAVLFYLEFAALGLLKLRSEQLISGRTADLIRLVSSSLLLMGAVYVLLDNAGMNGWIGSAFLLLAILHAGIAYFAFKQLSQFSGEILAFLAGGLFFATMALPAQLDGEWVSLGWAIEGVIVAWFAGRVRSQALLGGAFLLGLIGILKGLLFDVGLYTSHPNLFLNARFIVGGTSTVLLGVQGKLAGRFPEKEGSFKWQDAMWWAGVIGAVLVFFADTFWSLGADEAFSWLITSVMLMATGTAVLLLAPKKSSVTILGSILLLAVPIKIVLIDAWVGLDYGGYGLIPFRNAVIWTQLIVAGVLIVLVQPRVATREITVVCKMPTFSRLTNILALVSGIGVVTIEIMRKNSDWANTAVTILWAVCALVLILFGMKRRIAAYRYFGLILFAVTTLKVLLVDSSALKGLERIAAFMVTGVLLLALSFAYQKASVYFEALEAEQ